MNNFSSKLIQDAVDIISKMPGIGKRSALRMVLHLLKTNKEYTIELADTLKRLRLEISYCKVCNNISDEDTCSICLSTSRDSDKICIVENIQDVMAIETTSQYNGLYHVLGGSISPMDGIGPEDLHIDALITRISDRPIREIIFALSPTSEGDTTCFYIKKKLKEYDIRTTIISRGVAIGGELEYTDQITLGRSIIHRTSYE